MRLKGLSTYQVAKICDVHHTTVINWVNEGKLPAYTTPGGHRRIKNEDLKEFAKKYNIPISDSEGVEFEDRKKKLVLIVDDEKDVLDELKDALSGNGFDMEFASDGFEAGRKIYRHHPDLVLLDFKMPGMDGFQVCEVMRKDKETAAIPIIAVTALSTSEDRVRILSSGVNRYIPKPVDIKVLLSVINEFLGGGAK